MSVFSKLSSFRYERRKRKQEKKLEKFNQRQEEFDAKYKNEKQKSDFKNLLANLKFETYTKRLVAIVVFIALVDLQLSYVLAFLDKVQIAETLSIQVCTTLLGTILVYVIRAYFDTKAEKKNELIKSGLIVEKGSTIISNEALKNKIQEIISNTGVAEHINGSVNTTATENPEDSNSDICG